MSHLDICTTSYGKKKGRKSNWQFNYRPLKVGIRSDPGACKWTTTCRWTTLDNSYKFVLDLIPIRGLNKELCLHKIMEVQSKTISGLLLRSPETKSHSNVGAMERNKEYYMGEGGGFPRVRAVVNFVNPRSPMACPSTKGVPESELTNLLVGLMQFE